MRKETNNWWMQAKRDLTSAKNSFKSKDYYMVAFLCQQAVEKSLTALILHTKKEFYPSHSLIYLGKSVGIPHTSHSFLRELTPQYTISRYPNAAGEVPFELYDEEMASRFLKRSEKTLLITFAIRYMQLKKEVIESLKRELGICHIALSNSKKKLQQFEVKYNMSTEEFNTKFEKGQLGDDQDFFEWNAYIKYYQDWENRKQALEEILL